MIFLISHSSPLVHEQTSLTYSNPTPFVSLPSNSATSISHWTNYSISWLASRLQLLPTPDILQSSQTHWLNIQGDLFYFIFNITHLSFSLDHVFFSSSNKVILIFWYHITLMEERVQLKEKNIFRCFVRPKCMSSVVTCELTPLSMGKWAEGSRYIVKEIVKEILCQAGFWGLHHATQLTNINICLY